MTNEPVPTQAQQGRKVVPFIGWSDAAARFRKIAAENANHSTSVLLLGPTGVGKKTMARAWLHAAGPAEGADLKIIDLDVEDVERDEISGPVIATTTLQLPHGIPYLHLGTGKDEICELSAHRLPNEIVDRFTSRLYMPPLAERCIDILALLHYFNHSILPTQHGCSFESVSLALLTDMLSSSWSRNAAGLKEFFLASARRNANDRTISQESEQKNLGMLQAIPGLPLQRFFKDAQDLIDKVADYFDGPAKQYFNWQSKSLGTFASATSVNPIAVRFDCLPGFAVDQFLCFCSTYIANIVLPGLYETAIRDEVNKGNINRNLQIIEDMFRQSTFEQSIRTYLDLKRDLMLACLTKIPAAAASHMDTIIDFPCLGTTFGSLQDGLAIRPEHVQIIDENLSANSFRPSHSADFSTVKWFGKTYYFSSPIRRQIVEILWQAWEANTPGISFEYIKNQICTDSTRMADCFRDDPAWKTMIVEVPGRKGLYQLLEPTRSQNSQLAPSVGEVSKCFVTLNQMAALVGKSKDTLEKRLKDLPPPQIRGGDGKAHEWQYDKVRPALEKLFGRKLPERFPADRTK